MGRVYAWFWASVSWLALAYAADWPFDVTTLTAPDGSVSASYVSFGATLTQLWVKDKYGEKRDVVLGYDDPSKLLTDPDHPVFGGIVGRYANRIKNGTFSIPISKNPPASGPNVYHIPTNDHDGANTLHGGIYGWDRRNWTLVDKSPTSVTYKHLDAADEGFPGDVTAFVTHTVKNGGIVQTRIKATATEKTPIMLTQHVYWNLDAFKGSEDILNHTLRIDSSKRVAVDSYLIPTGDFIQLAGTGYDFRTPHQIGYKWNETSSGRPQGIDDDFVYNKPRSAGTSLWSTLSGIRLDISTNQDTVQVYTGNWLNTPRKAAHGGPSTTYSMWSAVALEQQGYIAAINTPEWGIDQIYGPGRDFEWQTTYTFSTVR